MSKRVLILVEGQTEERFVKDVLAPYFFTLNCFIIPKLLVTNSVKDGLIYKVCVTHLSKLKTDL